MILHVANGRWHRHGWVAAVGALAMVAAFAASGAGAPAGGASAPARNAPEATGPAWHQLSPAQQQALAPLQGDWPGIDRARKLKWLEVAARWSHLPQTEQARLHERMAGWSRLTPTERELARRQFLEARQFSADDRLSRWEAYQSLSEEDRQRWAQRAQPSTAASGAAPKPGSAAARPVAAKRNELSAPPPLPAVRAAPALAQAAPGATTRRLRDAPGLPPPHHQVGLPKIAATSGFVDPATLLPQRGPQGAAMQSPLPAAAAIVPAPDAAAAPAAAASAPEAPASE